MRAARKQHEEQQQRRRRRRRSHDDGDTRAPHRSSVAAAAARDMTWPTVYHYPSSLPFPVVLDAAMPCERYRSRRGELKTAVHWGQRKLLLSELQLLTRYARAGVSYHIVYAGAAPGTHLALLDDLFDGAHTWELIDPGRFDVATLRSRGNFVLRNEFFGNATAYAIVARQLHTHRRHGLAALYTHLTQAHDSSNSNNSSTAATTMQSQQQQLQTKLGSADVARETVAIPCAYETPVTLPAGLQLLLHAALEQATRPLLFVSDVRSGTAALPNFEDHVAENMRAQACWATLLHAEYSMLKFRLPYTHVDGSPCAAAGTTNTATTTAATTTPPASSRIAADGTVTYLRGDVLLPIWTRQTSTEGRLVVRRGAAMVPYDVARVEDQFFFVNARLREQVHFNHCVVAANTKDNDDDNNDDATAGLDHHYDAAAEVNVLCDYLRARRRHATAATRGDDSSSNSCNGDAHMAHDVCALSRRISAALGGSFAGAIRRLEATAERHARAREQGGVSDVTTTTTTAAAVQRALHTQAAAARARRVWWRNVDEAAHCTPSGFWVTTRMPQDDEDDDEDGDNDDTATRQPRKRVTV